MGRRVVSRADLEKCYYGGCRTIIISRDFIVPPGVMDAARSLGVRFVFVESKEFSDMVSRMCADYGMKDEDIVKEIVSRCSKMLVGDKKAKGLDLEG